MDNNEMTVKELIEKLKEYPKDYLVGVCADGMAYCELAVYKINKDREWEDYEVILEN